MLSKLIKRDGIQESPIKFIKLEPSKIFFLFLFPSASQINKQNRAKITIQLSFKFWIKSIEFTWNRLNNRKISLQVKDEKKCKLVTKNYRPTWEHSDACCENYLRQLSETLENYCRNKLLKNRFCSENRKTLPEIVSDQERITKLWSDSETWIQHQIN
jgi:hypothetical protein